MSTGDGLDGLFEEHDALGIGERVAAGEVSAQEVAAAGIARIARADARLGALARPMALGPSAAGPFSGVPFLVKDLMADCAGVATSAGSGFFGNDPGAAADSAAVRRMRSSGLAIVGRTKTSEFGLAPTTEPRFGGPVRNPWDPALSPGGSSGGSAALVGARALPMAHATDGGGSIRIPAALCGLFGLKPSRGRISVAPLGETLAGAGVQHCVSVSVRDSAALLDVLAGPEPGDPYGAPPPERSFLESARRDPPRLRVAVQRRPNDGPEVDAAVLRALDEAAKLIESLGHHVEEAAPECAFPVVEDALMTVMAANLWTNINAKAGGRTFGERDFEPVTWAYAAMGRDMGAAHYIRAVQAFHRTGRQLGAFFERHDVLLSPTVARARLPLGTVRMDGGVEDFRATTAPMIAFTAVHNISGTPAASVPLGWSEEGLPIGIQIAGAYGSEPLLLSLAGQLERAQPWRHRRPPVTA
jgi:amidase